MRDANFYPSNVADLGEWACRENQSLTGNADCAILLLMSDPSLVESSAQELVFWDQTNVAPPHVTAYIVSADEGWLGEVILEVVAEGQISSFYRTMVPLEVARAFVGKYAILALNPHWIVYDIKEE